MNIFKNINKTLIILTTAFAFLATSCVDDLNTSPIDPDSNLKDDTYIDLNSYESGLAKLYGGLALSGQKGPAGDADLGGLDEGASQYLRKYWEFQELPTDEALNGWGDPGQPALSQVTWTASNELVRILYYRMTYQMTLVGQFLRDTKSPNVGNEDLIRLNQMRAEAKFLRALSYWHALDFFGNGIPFITENSTIGSDAPAPPASGFAGTEIFDYIESELLSITDDASAEQLKPAKTGFVGQADKAAAYMLLAKLYMNADVYTGTPRWADAQKYIDLVIASGYSLEPNYEYNFLADNYLSNEIIFPIAFDGVYTQTYGGTTFLVSAAVGGDMNAKQFGINGGWGGNRSTLALVKKFENERDEIVDPRGMFFTGHNRENTTLAEFKDGYSVTKFKNVTSLGYPGSDPNGGFVDTNFPLFRLADTYLMKAEIEYRTSGSISDWTNIEALWERAGVSSDLQAKYKADASVDPEVFILDERARELYWEGHRRTDLVRFGKFVKGYNWPFKGGSPEGIEEIDKKYNILPLPGSELGANPKLTQNPLWN